jgi:antirestriction protein ArdC
LFWASASVAQKLERFARRTIPIFFLTEELSISTATAPTPRVDVYTRVTSQIVEALEQGVRPWMRPWNAENAAGRITRPLRHNGQPYKGVNILMLWASAELQSYACPSWLTFQQAKELGGNVKKGEHGSRVVYASTFKKKETGDDGQATEEEIPFLKEYTVQENGAQETGATHLHGVTRTSLVLSQWERERPSP